MARNNPGTHPPTALVARFSALGDVAMTIPALYAACRANPSRRFVMLTRRGFDAMFVDPPANLLVEGVDLSEPRLRGIIGMERLTADAVRRWKPDVFVDLHDVIRTKLIRLSCRLRGIRVATIDKGRSEKKRLTRHGASLSSPLKPQLERYRDTFARAGINSPDEFNGLWQGPMKAPAELFAKITGPKPDGRCWVAVAPSAAHPGKVYPPELMRQVVDSLAAHPHVTVFLLGGSDDRALLETWAQGRGNIVSLAGKNHGFAAELALLNHCDAALTMDSGNMHLAALAQTPLVSVWGATHPFAGFTPWQAKGSRFEAVQTDLCCRPCSIFGDKSCRRGDYACLRSISPQEIADAVMRLLA